MDCGTSVNPTNVESGPGAAGIAATELSCRIAISPESRLRLIELNPDAEVSSPHHATPQVQPVLR